MAYDVFLVSALEDRDMAKLVARRLRALKFKVWLDQKQTDDTFDAKDARNASNSQSMLVLWSENAVKSDWVRAAASIGHSRPGMLVQAGLDKTIPYEPFKRDKRHSLVGMTSRKLPEGFYEVIEELGRRDGRTDLREWMGFKKADEEEKDDWLKAHPTDPLAIHAEKKKARDLGKKPPLAADAVGAAALAAAAVKGAGSTSSTTAKAATASPALVADTDDESIGWGTLAAIGAAIAAMLFLGWVFRAPPAAQVSTSALPAVGNAYQMTDVCPAGTVPQSLLKQRPLEPGPIINDTED